VVLHLQGDLSLKNLPEVNLRARQALGLCPKLHLDLSQVTYMDASAYGWILATSQFTHELGGQLALENASQTIRKTLSFLGLDDLLWIESVPSTVSGQVCEPG
jgi:anti-anti-sigma factor